MTTNRRPTSSRNRAEPRKAEEPTSITVPLPGAAPIMDEPKIALERIGAVLRRMREQRGDDLNYIAEYLCIRPNFLVALENSHYDKLPADAYVIGFLRSYANYLGLDGKEAIDRYRNEMAGRRRKPSLVLPTPITEGRTPSAIIMIGAAIAAILIYALWYGLSSGDRTVVSTPPALPSTTVPESNNTLAPTAQPVASVEQPAAPVATNPEPVTPASSVPSSMLSTNAVALAPPPSDSGIMLSGKAPAMGMAPAASSTPAVAPAKSDAPKADQQPVPTAPTGQVFGNTVKDSHVTIRALQSSWVLVTDSRGQTVFDHVMKAGDTYKVPSTPGLSLTTGNGSGIMLSLDGSDLPKLATGASHVMRNVPLDSEHLRNLPTLSDE